MVVLGIWWFRIIINNSYKFIILIIVIIVIISILYIMNILDNIIWIPRRSARTWSSNTSMMASDDDIRLSLEYENISIFRLWCTVYRIDDDDDFFFTWCISVECALCNTYYIELFFISTLRIAAQYAWKEQCAHRGSQ